MEILFTVISFAGVNVNFTVSASHTVLRAGCLRHQIIPVNFVGYGTVVRAYAQSYLTEPLNIAVLSTC